MLNDVQLRIWNGRFVFDTAVFPSDNSDMALTKPRIKSVVKQKAKAAAKQLTNAQLLKLAARHRAPQSWYEEQADPTKPAASNGRGK